MTDIPAKPKIGRPTDYTPELGELICRRIMEGTGVKTMCREEDMPAFSTVFMWVARHPEFAKVYHEARGIQRDSMAEEITDIADEALERGDPDAARVELLHRDQRLKSRQWILAKLDDRFREKSHVQHSGSIGVVKIEGGLPDDEVLPAALAAPVPTPEE